MKKKTKKKPLRKKAAKPKRGGKKPARAKKEKPIGTVTHYFRKIKVGIVKFKKPVKAGERIEFRGATTFFSQTADSMQFDHKPVSVAKPGKEVGLKVLKKVREGDAVYKAPK